MGFKIKGLKEFQKQLNNMEKAAKELQGTNNVPFSVLFNNEFMTKYTNYSTFDELLNNSGFKVETEEDFKNIPDLEWDQYIKQVTVFENWDNMLSKAGKIYATKKLGF
ncbi:hypothetical protein ABES36_14360 [Bacillus pseudomycoides]|uniref:hypothetical protein n=1 Tax=Bacillus pseudomycoides TaxID=64104 RepID=UPI003D200DC9